MKIIRGLADRILFAAGVLIFLQLPHFVDQYSQRVGGYRQAVAQHLRAYQGIADDQFGGDMDALISAFESSDNPAVIQTAENIEKTRHDLTRLESALTILEGNQFFRKLLYLVTAMNIDIAKETLKTFKPGIPFSIEAAACGLAGGMLFSGIFIFLVWLPKPMASLVFRNPGRKSTAR